MFQRETFVYQQFVEKVPSYLLQKNGGKKTNKNTV